MADFDADIRKALEEDEAFQGLMQQLKEAITAEVTVRDDSPCSKPGCNCKHIRMVKVPDYKLKLQIAEFMANRGVGRPTQAEGETGEKVNFVRHVCKCGKCECAAPS